MVTIYLVLIVMFICLSHNHLLNISSSVLFYFIFDGWGIISARYACVQGLRLAL